MHTTLPQHADLHLSTYLSIHAEGLVTKLHKCKWKSSMIIPLTSVKSYQYLYITKVSLTSIVLNPCPWQYCPGRLLGIFRQNRTVSITVTSEEIRLHVVVTCRDLSVVSRIDLRCIL